MSRDPSSKLIGLPLPEAEHVDRTCDRFEAAWRAGERPRIEDYLAELPAGDRPALLRHLVALDADYRRLRVVARRVEPENDPKS